MQKIVVAITGASGSVYAKVLLEKLEQVWQQGHSLELSLLLECRPGLGNRAGKPFL